MRRKKTTAAESESDAKSEVQAQAIAQVLLASCALLDTVLDEATPDVVVRLLLPVVLKMETYLGGRPPRRGAEPLWVDRMRRTVTRFKLRLKLSQGETRHALH